MTSKNTRCDVCQQGWSVVSPEKPINLCAEHLFEWDHGVPPDEQIPQNPVWRFHALSEQPVG